LFTGKRRCKKLLEAKPELDQSLTLFLGNSGPSPRRDTMKWVKPSIYEVCVGMEVTSYESAEIDPFN
jgi:coenzyme PQQ precursor peptide PqqA